MKIFKIPVLVLLAFTAVFFTACDKDDDNDDPTPTPTTAAKLTIEMGHLAGTKKFYFDSTYTTLNGDNFTADLFKYYISNIRLIRSNNTEYSIPQTYFLVNHAIESSLKLQLSNLGNGSFTGIKFLLGVDSLRNVSGAQTGALDPNGGMFWDWNTGYIFLKLEGASPAIPTSGQTFTYHVGGFSGQNVNYREINLDFDGDVLPLANNTNPELHIVVDVLEIFKNPTTIDLATFPSSVMSVGPNATILANNYMDLFTYSHIHTD